MNENPPEATACTMVMPGADQSRLISTKTTNLGQVTVKSIPNKDRRGDTSQQQSNNGLRRSSRPRRAPTHYGQSEDSIDIFKMEGNGVAAVLLCDCL